MERIKDNDEFPVACPNCLNTVWVRGGEYGTAYAECDRCGDGVQVKVVYQDGRYMEVVENVRYIGFG